MPELLPIFVNLERRRVLIVGGGPVAASKLATLSGTGADIVVVSPEVCDEMARAGVTVVRREFQPSDLDGVWLAIAAAPSAVNRQVAEAANERQVLVNAVDDPANASVYLGGVVRRAGVTLAISTSGEAPGLAGLLREALDHVLPAESDLAAWLETSRRERVIWRRDGVPMEERRPLLLEALNQLYAEKRGLVGSREG